MFDHIGIFVSDPDRSISFLEACLRPLGIEISERQPEWGSVVFMGKSDKTFLWVGPAQGEYYGSPLAPSLRRPAHLAFRAANREAVDAFHRIGLEYGGRDNGAPEQIARGIYHAFLLDPDGNNIEAIFRD